MVRSIDDSDDPSIYQENDEVHDKLVNIINNNARGVKDVVENSRELHLWISDKANAQSFDKAVERMAEEGFQGERKGTSNKPIARQKKIAREILEASEFLMSYLEFQRQFSSLDHVLSDAHNALKKSHAKMDCGAGHSNNFPEWYELRERLHGDLRLLNGAAKSALEHLGKIKVARGQPKKIFRDEVLAEFQARLVKDLNLSISTAMIIVEKSWHLYFPEEKVDVEIAKMVRRKSVKRT
jgi:hypothetical protein